jgi:hypothetical protein
VVAYNIVVAEVVIVPDPSKSETVVVVTSIFIALFSVEVTVIVVVAITVGFVGKITPLFTPFGNGEAGSGVKIDEIVVTLVVVSPLALVEMTYEVVETVVPVTVTTAAFGSGGSVDVNVVAVVPIIAMEELFEAAYSPNGASD